MKKIIISAGTLFFLLIFLPQITFASSSLVIDEFQISGESADDEYVVIYNNSADSIILNDYTLSRKTKTGTSFNTLYKFINFTFAPFQKVKISHSKYTGAKELTYSTTSYSITADNTLAIIAPDKSYVDYIGFGEATLYEGNPIDAPQAKQIFQRTNGIDSDNNFNDFRKLENTIVLDPNLSKIIISELFPSPSAGNSEWFEIYNPTSLNINLNGLKVCDGAGSVRCFSFTNIILPPFTYQTFENSITKITLNNTGDWLELFIQDDLIFETENFSDGETAMSYSLFGSKWDWTKQSTKNAQNQFVSIVEVEEVKVVTPKTKKSKTKVAKSVSSSENENEEEQAEKKEVKGVTDNQNTAKTKPTISKNILGISLIILAGLIMCGYILWEKKEYLSGIFNKIKR